MGAWDGLVGEDAPTWCLTPSSGKCCVLVFLCVWIGVQLNSIEVMHVLSYAYRIQLSSLLRYLDRDTVQISFLH